MPGPLPELTQYNSKPREEYRVSFPGTDDAYHAHIETLDNMPFQPAPGIEKESVHRRFEVARDSNDYHGK